MITERQPLSSVLADRLAAMIISDGTYKPGDRLPPERELAETLGASRTSIREAAKLLEARGLLEIRRGVGTFVSANPGITRDPLNIVSTADTVTLLEDWYRVRMILEGEAMEMVAQNATDDELYRIRLIMEEEERLIGGPVDMDFMNADQYFHCELARATHNVIMERLIPSLHASVYYDMVRSLYCKLRPRYNKNAIDNHALIMKHLELRDGNGAKVAMRYHMLVAIEDVRSVRDPEAPADGVS